MNVLFLELLSALAAAYVTGYYLLCLVMVISGYFVLRSSRRSGSERRIAAAISSGSLPSITVIVPAFREEDSILRTVRSLLAVDYPNLSVIIVNDGSPDSTLVRLADFLDLVPSGRVPLGGLPTAEVRAVLESRLDRRVLVIDKINAGKADALNCGISFAETELVCNVDADVHLERSALTRLALAFVDAPDLIAASGTIRPINGCSVNRDCLVAPGLPPALLERIQVLEYLRSFSVGRLFFNLVDGHVLISGAFGLFRRSVLLRIGGYQAYAIGEDMEIVVRLHSVLRPEGKPYRIVAVPEAVLFTDVPHSVSELGRQRTRWHEGLLSTLRLHRGLIGNPRFGSIGLVALPYFLVFELLSPVIETIGWMALPLLAILSGGFPAPAAAFLFATFCLSALVSLAAILLDSWAFGFFRRPSELAALAGISLLEPWGYHQLTLFYRLKAFWSYYHEVKLRGGWTPPSRV